ncbi:hypothetical protein AB4151_25180, partial [Vibrio splendidus]
IGADDFFHARIVTASHLLFLSLCFNLKSIDWGGRSFATSNHLNQFIQGPAIRTALSKLFLVLVTSTYLSLFIL